MCAVNTWRQTLLGWAFQLAAASPSTSQAVLHMISDVHLHEGRFQQALEVNRHTDDPNRYYLSRIAVSSARAGDLAACQRILVSIARHYDFAQPDRRFAIDEVLANAYAAIGLFDEAARFASRIRDVEVRADVLASLATRASEFDRPAKAKEWLNEAIATASMIRDSDDLALRFVSISRACGRCALPQEGRKAAELANGSRLEAFAELALEYSRVAPRPDALALTNEVLGLIRRGSAHESESEVQVLVRVIILAFAWCADDEKVSSLLHSLSDEWERINTLVDLADVYAKRSLASAVTSFLQQALARAKAATQLLALNRIAEQALRLSNLDIALGALMVPMSEHWSSYHRAVNLGQLARAFAQQGENEKSSKLLELGFEIAYDLKRDNYTLLRKLAVDCVEVCDDARAFRVLATVHGAPEMSDSYWRALTLLDLRAAFQATKKVPTQSEMQFIRTALANPRVGITGR